MAFTDVPLYNPMVGSHEIGMADLYGMPLSAWRSATITFTNTGTQPIVRADAAQPIHIELTAGRILLRESTLQWRRHGQLVEEAKAVTATQEEGGHGLRYKIDAPLINPGDGFILRVLVAQLHDLSIKMWTRYPGLPNIELLHYRFVGLDGQWSLVGARPEPQRFIWARKFAPKLLRYSRASQMSDLRKHLMDWKDETPQEPAARPSDAQS